jgi:hypothetical protein
MVGFILLSRFTTICVDEVPAPRSHLTDLPPSQLTDNAQGSQGRGLGRA